MARRMVRYIVLMTVSAYSVAGFAFQGGPPEKLTRIALGFDLATPGEKVMVPVILEVPDGIVLGEIVSEVTFPSDVLTLVEVMLGDSGKEADAKLASQVRTDASDPKRSVVTVRVTTAGKAITTGIAASMVFKISQSAPVDTSVSLSNAPLAFTLGDGRPIVPIEGGNGEIKVAAAGPVISCFFYMH